MRVNGRKVGILWGLWWLNIWGSLYLAWLACRVWWAGEPESARCVVGMLRRSLKAMRLFPYIIISGER